MLVEYNKINENSRIWIFTSDRKITQTQGEKINNLLSNFLANWQSHKSPLFAGYNIFKSFFLVIALDENQNPASGCSIDLLYKEILKIETSLNISFTNRLKICIDDNDIIKSVLLNELKKHADLESLFYDTTINIKKDLKELLKPINQGWCKNYL